MSLTPKQKDTIREEINSSTITGHVSGRYLILIGGKKDREWDGGGYEENEYQYLDDWVISKLDQAYQQGAKDKVEEVRKYFEERKEDIQAIMEFIDTSLKDNT